MTCLDVLVGHSFNLRSTQQLSQVLFDEMKFPTRGLAQDGLRPVQHRRGCAGRALSLRRRILPSPAHNACSISSWNNAQLEKLRGTYVDALPTLVNPATGRLHTSFSQTGAVTGRLSKQQPKLAEYPDPHRGGPRDSPPIASPAGWSLISADYSQVELRVLAHIADEDAAASKHFAPTRTSMP